MNIDDLFGQLLGTGGVGLPFPVTVGSCHPSASDKGNTPAQLLWGCDRRNFFWYEEDFLRDAIESDPAFTLYDISAAGSPSTGLVANGTGGQYQITLASTDEAEFVAFAHANQLVVNGALPFACRFRVKVGHTMGANEQVFWGLGSTLAVGGIDGVEDVAKRAVFRLDGGFSLYRNVDDATTDTNTDTGFDVTEDVFAEYWIVRGFDGYIHFGVANNYGQSWTYLGRIDGSSLTGNLQPMFGAGKASGTTQPQIFCDVYGFMGARSLT